MTENLNRTLTDAEVVQDMRIQDRYSLDEALAAAGPETRENADRFTEVRDSLTEFVSGNWPVSNMHRRDVVYAIRLLRTLERQSWDERTENVAQRETIGRLQAERDALKGDAARWCAVCDAGLLDYDDGGMTFEAHLYDDDGDWGWVPANWRGRTILPQAGKAVFDQFADRLINTSEARTTSRADTPHPALRDDG